MRTFLIYLKAKSQEQSKLSNQLALTSQSGLVSIMKTIILSYHISFARFFVGETSSAYGGGAPGYSNRFISSFIWLDKLGLAAKNGISLVIRQSFFKGYYALIDDNYNPNPDWWVSVLYKTLVGPEVVSCDSASDKRVRLYCHCTNAKMMYDSLSSLTSKSLNVIVSVPISVFAVFGINVKETDAKIRLEGILPPDEAEKYPQSAFAYVITTEFSLLSR